MYSLYSFFLILSDDNAFSESETVSLDDCGVAVLLFEVSDSLVGFSENLIESSRDVVFFHQFLGEYL